MSITFAPRSPISYLAHMLECAELLGLKVDVLCTGEEKLRNLSRDEVLHFADNLERFDLQFSSDTLFGWTMWCWQENPNLPTLDDTNDAITESLWNHSVSIDSLVVLCDESYSKSKYADHLQGTFTFALEGEKQHG